MARLFLIFAGATAIAGAAIAQTPAIDIARNQGAVGERYDGYMGFPGDASASLRSQVGAINIKRRSLYSQLAAQKGVSPQDVGVTAGCQLLARVGTGEAYLMPDNVWRRRAASQAAPQPSYCR